MPIQPINRSQPYEDLVKRHAQYHDAKIRAEADLRNANDALTQVKDDARKNWSTDDLEELTRMLRQMEAENEQHRREYQAKLDGIEAELRQVEEQFKQAESAK